MVSVISIIDFCTHSKMCKFFQGSKDWDSQFNDILPLIVYLNTKCKTFSFINIHFSSKRLAEISDKNNEIL